MYETTNMNPETGIHYGTIYLDNLEDWVFDEFFYHGTNLTEQAAFDDAVAIGDVDPDDDESVQSFWDCTEFDECEYELETDGMKLGLSYLGGAAMVWIFESPHTTRASLCSPCVPNAGALDSQHENGVDCYTLPQDWFCQDNAA